MVRKLSADNNAVNWFEIPVTNTKRAKTFYETILDIEMTMATPENGDEMVFFPRLPDTVMGLSGILSGALVKNKQAIPGKDGLLIYLNASPELQPVLDKIERAGGQIVLPKTKTPAGQVAIMIDTEGNKVGLHAPE